MCGVGVPIRSRPSLASNEQPGFSSHGQVDKHIYRRIRVGQARTVPRKLHADVPVSMLDEDYGPIAGADELRALVTLIPAPKRMTFRESNLVSKP